MTPRPGALQTAARIPLDNGPALDPVALLGPTDRLVSDRRRTVVGLGDALALDLAGGLDDGAGVAGVSAALAAVPCRDLVGDDRSGVVALGALPFDRSLPARLVVPVVTYVVEADGHQWATVLASTQDALGPAAGPDAPGPGVPTEPAALRRWLETRVNRSRSEPPPAPVRTVPRWSDDGFVAAVTRAVDAIDDHEVAKVVLARQVDVTMDGPIDVAALLGRWRELEPRCTIFAVPTGSGLFVGASPELLVDRSGTAVVSRPLAGTTDRTDGDGGTDLRGTDGAGRSRHDAALPDRLDRSAKDADEHRLVVDAIARVLADRCTRLDVPGGPDLVRLHSIVHLGTTLEGVLRPSPDGRLPSALDLVAALHPTPAVGGVPVAAARALIARLEPEPRGPYAGPVGYVDAAGDGRWVVGIRALSVRGDTARLAAGVGIVAGSRPATERAETDLKLAAAFAALAPGRTLSTAGNSRPVAARG